ncbi:hypothetical protein HQQ88_02315 [Curtobacterium sp. VKM Ac-2861]|uniref:hypothetical protein n=1 Tax=unclassified Curtobacterium TaxID=257496 RepID=UPI0015672639|nr:hypothetical protein [Curtobacterium sp. MWU13-2055]NQW89134.1 hypothetical protein [Curtobacterium sp. VKM Ac-2861]
MIDASDLLAHPRGRRFCLELVSGVQDPADPAALQLGDLLFWAEHHLGVERGDDRTLFGIGGAVGPEPAPDLAAVASALAAVPLPSVGEDDVVVALESTADSALWWQQPDALDALLARTELQAALRRLARWAVDSPVVRRLFDPQGGAWSVEFDEGDQARRPSAEAALADWALELRDEISEGSPGVASGVWWTTPPWPLAQHTRAPFPSAGPLALWAVEDSFGQERAVVSAVPADFTARVCTVDGPADWAALCRRWPLDVTGTTRRNDWAVATGRQGDWVQPDWSAVATEYDVVHLTVAGWFRTSGLTVPVDGSRASVVAGWTPDSAYRLTDRGAGDEAVTGDPETWSRPGNAGVWRRLS